MQYEAHSRLKEVATQTIDSVRQIGLLCQLFWVQLIQKKSNTGLSYAHISKRGRGRGAGVGAVG